MLIWVMIMLKISKLVAGYGKAIILKGVDITVKDGEFVSIIGPNGAGKSTLLKCICGLIKATSGRIEFNGKQLNDMDSAQIISQGITLCPEGRMLVGTLTVKENIELGAYLRKDDIQEDWKLVYKLFPRLEERKVQQARTLSGGEQQMVAIARAIMGKPRLLVLDEVTIGLAPILVQEIGKKLSELHKLGITILLVEQNAKLALNLTDRCYVIEFGSILQEGPSAELRNDKKIQAAYLGV
jgi:branched-chain amino acid transport system ATP-binding protein